MAKQIWEITPQDIQDYAVWQFPSWKDDSHDETVICQASQDDALDPNSNIIVRAKFVDANGNEFIGFIHYGLAEVEHSQPNMFVNGKTVGFWFGITKPNHNDLIRLNFPIVITSESVFGLEQITVTIEGYSYVNEASATCVMSC
ncbi:hypothetical protein BCT19_04085 [Vibrio splendidus]|uniref:hypothetical protein n=1 Tax=Vibrio TaxID=662 RepID=UPI000C855D0E|nr:MULTISPECIES: hypothetical protein [Vibrio]PMN99853.1 hypothetical protein BCT19_04085 [Vibrio splendidus]PTO86941.1 hypothetical protein CWO08_23655 [Vibrio sp. 10N.286.48.B8]